MDAESLARFQMRVLFKQKTKLFEQGMITKAELEKFRPGAVTVVNAPAPVAANEQPKPDVKLSPEQIKMAGELRTEMEQIDKLKCMKSNELTNVPKNVNAIGIVTEILELREKWAGLRQKLMKVELGESLEDVTEETVINGLPEDRAEVERMLQNRMKLRSKDKGKLEKAKELATQRRLEQKIAEHDIAITAMRALVRG
jgi:hypothetical protein